MRSTIAHRLASNRPFGGCSRPRQCVGGRMHLIKRRAEEPSSPAGTKPQVDEVPQSAVPKIQRTMADLDSLLGIVPEPVADPTAKNKAWRANTSKESTGNEVGLDISPTALDKIAEADRLREAASKGRSGTSSDIEAQMQKIVDKARKLAEEQAAAKKAAQASGAEPAKDSSSEDQKALRREFDELLTSISKPPDEDSGPTKEEVKRLKDAAFGPLTFWVIETRPIQDSDRPGLFVSANGKRNGLLIRGNLRDDREKVFKHVCDKVAEIFSNRYEVLMVEDNEEGAEGGGASSDPGSSPAVKRNVKEGPRVAFQIIPAEQALPPQTDGIRRIAAAIMGLLLIGSSLQLALASNINKLPAETLAWFANPDNLNSDQLPPGLENWDPTSYIETALPVLSGLLAVQVAHEAGHRIAAAINGVKLGPSFFVPYSSVGSFGAITPFTSMLKNRMQLWDVAAAGPLAGLMASTALLVVGLMQSTAGDQSVVAAVDPAAVAIQASSLVAVPSGLFQGSLLLSGIVRAVLGEAALRGSTVLVSPLVIAGWCGLITTALNTLPVGCLDGGRLVQASYGKQALSLSSFFTYLGLGLGLLGSSLALPFGLYVIICQQTAEKYIKDSVTPTGQGRETATAVAVLVAVLILLPLAPELAESFGVGSTNPFL